jgi:hypothetical protein
MAQDGDQWCARYYDNEPLGFIKGGEFLVFLRNC